MKDLAMTLLLAFLSTVGTGVVTWIGVQLANLITAHVKITWLRATLVRLDTEVFSVVRMVEQTFVDKSRKPDGSLDPAHAKEAFDQAMAALKTNLGATWMQRAEAILGAGGGIEQLLSSRIEAAVSQMPSNPMPSGASVAPPPLPHSP